MRADVATIDNQPVQSGEATQRERITELITLGRDREAAALATRLHEDQTDRDQQGGSMDVLSQFEELGPLLATTVGGISADQLDNSTPCAQFTVRGVLEHMIGGATVFAAGFRGELPAETDVSDVLAAFGPALSELGAAVSSPGALDRTIQAPFGEVPGEMFARFVVLDGLVHGWDLAVSTGQGFAPSNQLVAAVEDFARDALPPLRDGGQTFGDATEPPANASPVERLAALTGRRV